MLEFDGATIANMTAALEHGCKLLPKEQNSIENRKRIGSVLADAARSGYRTLLRLQEVAEAEARSIRLERNSDSKWKQLLRRLGFGAGVDSRNPA